MVVENLMMPRDSQYKRARKLLIHTLTADEGNEDGEGNEDPEVEDWAPDDLADLY